MPRTWHGLNPGAETLPGCLFLQTEPGKAWKILSGPESNILTLGSCCWICSHIIKKNSSCVFLGSFAKVLFVAVLAACVISSVVWMMNSGGLILFKKEDLTQHGEIACFAKLHGGMLKSLAVKIVFFLGFCVTLGCSWYDITASWEMLFFNFNRKFPYFLIKSIPSLQILTFESWLLFS